MTPSVVFAIPGDLQTLTGGYGYDRRILAEARAAGFAMDHLRLPGDYPFPAPVDVAASLAMLRAAPRGAVLLVDGLAYAALPPLALAALQNPVVALTHHPLGLETGLDATTSQRLIDNERAALARADAVIVTSNATRDTLVADFAAPPAKVVVAEPGVDPAPRAAGSGAAAPVLMAVGSIVPRKGYDVLIDALAPLRHLDWRLRIVGSPDRAPDCAAALRAQVVAAGLGERVEFIGELSPSNLGALYARTDLFVLSSHYEGYGMVLSEAMARGLPIVATTGGAAAQTVPDAAALKAPPGDAAALRAALARAIAEPDLRARLSDASWIAGQSLPRWAGSAAIVLEVLKRVAGARP